jgi:hypothetical protein
MNPPSVSWEPWVYRGAMMVIGAVNIFGVVHFD